VDQKIGAGQPPRPGRGDGTGNATRPTGQVRHVGQHKVGWPVHYAFRPLKIRDNQFKHHNK
jgi:hypothetical protein